MTGAKWIRRTPVWVLLLAFATVAGAERAAVTTVEFDAPSVGRTMKYNVILPKDYASSDTRYPVLYLLHGLTSNYAAWAFMGVRDYAGLYDLIIVMPDAGNSWYTNWAQSEGGQKNDWEDYMVNDLIEHVDGTYRTIAAREGRAINGLSMGGFGAIMLGLRHPDLFCSVGSHSGALSHARGARERMESDEPPRERRWKPSDKPAKIIGIPGFSSQVERYPKGKEFVTTEDCDAYDPFKLVLQVPVEDLPHIHIDCGTEDRLIESAQAFMKVLMDNTIPFSYAQSLGRHAPPYWTREVAHSMAVQYTVIQRNLKATEKAQNND